MRPASSCPRLTKVVQAVQTLATQSAQAQTAAQQQVAQAQAETHRPRTAEREALLRTAGRTRHGRRS